MCKEIRSSPSEGGLTASALKEIFGECPYDSVILKKYTASEAIQKIKEYKEQEKQKCESCFTEKLTKEKWASAKDCKNCSNNVYTTIWRKRQIYHLLCRRKIVSCI